MADPERPIDPASTTADPAATRPLGTGETIGAYQLLSRLGSGGMGDVFLALDRRLRRHVAIKRVRADLESTPRARERLRREAAAAGTLNHPAIVQVYDIVEDAPGEAIVMEYVEGQTLAAMLRGGPLTTAQAVRIARQVAEGLAAAHVRGLVHRDLKVQNVMVTGAGQAKILDFGIVRRLADETDEEAGPPSGSGAASRLAEALTAEGVPLGTSRAMSPEQAEGRPLDARSDLFSLGVLLYETCTGRSPFAAESRSATLHRLIHERPPPIADLNPQLPATLVALIEELLAKDPERRPAQAALVAERLGHIEAQLGGHPVAVPSKPPWSPPARRARTRIVAGAGLLLLALLALPRLRPGPAPAPPLAVLVQEPDLGSGSDHAPSRLATFALREAALRALADLEGIEPIGPGDLPESASTVQEAARAVAADELLVPSLVCEGRWCQVSLRRERGRDGRVMADSGPFDVSSEPEDLTAFADAVAIHVRGAFPERRARSAGEGLEVRAADYPRYLDLLRKAEAGALLGRTEVDELEQIARSSPGLAEAAILASGAARALLDRAGADRILREAESRHPSDPRLVYERFTLELYTGRMADAETALARLESLAPGDVRVWRARALLFARQGRLREAAEVQRRLAHDRPSWKNLWYVANVEMEMADAEGARGHLEELLRVSPDNPRGLSKMAELENLMGDPLRAASIYERLLKDKVTLWHLSNLGWSRLLAGDYAAASAALRRALEVQPDHLASRLNLAISLEGGGDVEGARHLYRDVLERITEREKTSTLTVAERLIEAQALARLGEPVRAVTLTVQALGEGDRDAQVFFQASIIYALCGEVNNALVQAKEARRRGLSARWFGIPGFERVRDAPAFRELLAS